MHECLDAGSICAYIERNCGNVTKKEVADYFEISVRTLSRFLEKEAYPKFRDLVCEARVKKAAELLEHNGLVPIEEVAEKTGYSDRKSLECAFRNRYGVTPTEYKYARLCPETVM